VSAGRVVRVTSRSFGETSPEAHRLLEAAGLTVIDEPRGPFGGDALVRQLAGAHGAIVGTDELDAAVLDSLPDLRAIVKHGIGVDNIDLPAAQSRGITVANVRGANAGAVADYVVGVMIAVVRRLVAAQASLARGEWSRFVGRDIGEATVGLIGFGRTGRAVARRLAGFGSRIVTVDPALDAHAAALAGVELMPFEDLLRAADVVSLHLPLAAATHHLIDGAALARMKRGAILINAARGELVDERALAAALDAGVLAGAAVDVFDREPPRADHPLLGRTDVLCTPHIAAYTLDALCATSTTAARHVIDILAGAPCPDVLVGPLTSAS
jgi:D-3-phosphoglycerate dehydrogenase / 2-oxoglutarate reductase